MRRLGRWTYAFFKGLFSPFRGVYGSFDQARKSAPLGKKIGYDNPEAANLYLASIDHILPSEYAPILWLSNILQTKTIIFDLGGNVGLSFYNFQRYLSLSPGVRWIVYDLPTIVKAGEELASENFRHRSHGLEFTSDIQLLGDADVLIAFGSLQYIDEELAKILSCAGNPKHILINRTPLHDDSTFVTIQDIGPVRCAYRIFHRTKFIESITALGYSLIDSWNVLELSCHVCFHVKESVPFYSGLYFRL